MIALQPLGDKAASAIEIESEISTKKSLRLQTAKKQIRIRHSRLMPRP